MKRSGFTLIELAIVLIVVGLILGGITKGYELVRQSKIRDTLTDISSYNAAINTFRVKYKYLPGDFVNAYTYGVDQPKGGAANVSATVDAQNDGNGDGLLQNSAGNFTTNTGEIANFWMHLSNVKLIKEEYDITPPANVGDYFPRIGVGNGLVALTGDGALYWVLGVADVVMALNAAEGAADGPIGNSLIPEEAYGIDSKIDDGKPDAGDIQAIQQYSASGVFVDDADTDGGATDCMTAAAEYNLTIDDQACTVRIEAVY